MSSTASPGGGLGAASGTANPPLKSKAATGARLLGALLFFATAFYFAYRYGMAFSYATASPFWFPDSVLLCALLLNRPRRWWLFVLAALPIRLFSAVAQGLPLWFLLATFAIDSAKGLATAFALRRFLKNPLRIDTVRDLLLYALFAVLLVPATAALAGAAARQALGNAFWPTWQQWLLGNALTHLVVTPAILYWVFGARRAFAARSPREWLEPVLLAAALVLTSRLAFGVEPGSMGLASARFFAPTPFLFWAAVRYGMLGASGAMAVLAYFAVAAALHGAGPFSAGTPAEIARALQGFLATRAMALSLVAVLVQQMRSVGLRLRESEKRFRDMADTAPVLIWKSDAAGGTTFVNQGWLEFAGLGSEEALGDAWIARVHPDDLPHCLEVYATHLARRESFTLECRLRRADEVYRWFVCSGTPSFAEDGSFLGSMGSCIDVTDQKEAGLEMERHRAELAHVSRVAMMGELTASVAHELKQPLGAILSNAEAAEILLAAEPPALGEVKEILRDIREDDQRAGEILRKMRSFLEKNEIERKPLDVNPLVEEIFRLMKIEAAERNVAMTLETAGEPQVVAGDRVHLQQVLMNLILNGFEAVAALPAGRQLIVRTGRDGERVVITVSDNGPGIPEERMPRLFEPFWSTKQGGMGLGLSITRSIVEAHGGRVWAENPPGGGAAFHVSLPSSPQASA